MTRLYTIGFTQKNASEFFSLLNKSHVKQVIDTRLNNRSQLAGFSKADDLRYFLRTIGSIDYIHDTSLAPTQLLLNQYRKHKAPWSDYARDFEQLMLARAIEDQYTPSSLDAACLLCSEHEPEFCHRRLVAEYFQRKWPQIEIVHLM